jgi:hypothetical protein
MFPVEIDEALLPLPMYGMPKFTQRQKGAPPIRPCAEFPCSPAPSQIPFTIYNIFHAITFTYHDNAQAY